MTSQPDQYQADSRTDPVAGTSAADSDPDLVILDEEGDLDEERDLDDDVADGVNDVADGVNDDPAVIVAEVTETETGLPPTQADNGDTQQQWRDIQAMFVDDPRASVQLAAQAVDNAVGTLVETLHKRQSELPSAAGAAENPGDTEQLRETLRSCRLFCQSLADLSRQLEQPAGAAA